LPPAGNIGGTRRPGTLVAGWKWDIGRLGTGVTNFLCQKLAAGLINNLEPSDFFTLNGVKVRSDLVEFPEANFYLNEKSNLVLFMGDVPEFRWFQFFNRVFDISEQYISIQQFFVIGGISTFLYHTGGRDLIGIYNSQEMKRSLDGSGLASEFDYETPPDQKPSINSFFLWAAWKRQISGACIFATVPFYLADLDDYAAQKSVLNFLNQRLNLELDLSEFEDWQEKLEVKIDDTQRLIPEVEYYLDKVKKYRLLDEDEQTALTRFIFENCKD